MVLRDPWIEIQVISVESQQSLIKNVILTPLHLHLVREKGREERELRDMIGDVIAKEEIQEDKIS